MTRRVFLLMGIAILVVVLSHAAGWGQIAMVNWADRYRSVTVPNFDAVGSLDWDIIVFVRQAVVWAVPAFLFCSAFFVAYAARGSSGVYSWKIARARFVDLLVPYLIWSLVWFAADALEGNTLTFGEYVRRLIVGKADGGAYFFIPMLCQFYLLSPLIVPMARSKPKQLLAAAALIQLAGFVLEYLKILGVAVPPSILLLTQSWLFFMWTTYFALGLVCGFHGARLKQELLRRKWILIGALLLFGAISLFESEAIFWASSMVYDVRYVPFSFSAWFFSIAVILAFVAFEKIAVPFPARVQLLASKSYGIYLTHIKVMFYGARSLRQIAPKLLAYPILVVMPLMLVVGLAVPLLLMDIVSRSPVRRFYRYLFG